MRSQRVAAVIIAIGLAAAACSSDTSTTTDAPATTTPPPATTTIATPSTELDAILSAAVAEGVLPSVGVTVFTSEDIIDQSVAGVRRQGDPTPVEIDDKYHIGSNVKAMTSTLVGTFVDEGALAWEATLDELFSASVANIDKATGGVTLAQLLNHTSGIDDEILAAALSVIPDDIPLPEQRLMGVETITADAPTQPLGQHLYSNFGYTMVGSALEQMTGQSWEDLMTARIFEPLGMDSCGFYAPGTPGTVDQPWGHNTDLGGQPMDPGDPDAEYPKAIAPAGLAHCNMADWATFLQTQLRGFRGSEAELVSGSVFAALGTPAAGTNYGLGWLVEETPGGIVLSHSGSNDRFLAVAILLPGADWGMLAVTNLGEQMATEALDEVIDQVIMGHLGNTPSPEDMEANAQQIVDDRLTAWAQDEVVVGGVAGVVVPGLGSIVSTAGWSDRESGTTLTPNQPLRIGSLTKMFTAAVVLDLVNNDVIGLEEAVTDHVAALDPAITIGQLLDHTSGLRDSGNADDIMAAVIDPSLVIGVDEAINTAIANGPATAPGTTQEYANVNYLLLGKIVESATEQPFADVLRERLVDPIGLTATGFDQTGIATGYEAPAPGSPPTSLVEFDTNTVVASSWTAGGLVSSADDLLTFVTALVEGRLLSPELFSQMLDTTTAPRDGYGLGVASYEFQGRIVFGHNGRTVGASAAIRHDPATGVTTVVASNDGTADTIGLAEELLAPDGPVE